ncbi:MAG: TrmH family RNA methyltransferase [Candidatus Roizmanbacteria bacterium]
MKLNAKQIRDLEETTELPDIKRYPVIFILDNLYDTYNIGGIFRLADALAVTHLYICGDSETPPNHRIKKASIGTYKLVPWSYKKSAKEAMEEAKKLYPEIKVLSIEQNEDSTPFQSYDYPSSEPIAFVVGNETEGVSLEAQKASDAILEIPMLGVNSSLNVIVSLAIVSTHIYTKLGYFEQNSE